MFTYIKPSKPKDIKKSVINLGLFPEKMLVNAVFKDLKQPIIFVLLLLKCTNLL